jgi:flagellin-like protein
VFVEGTIVFFAVVFVLAVLAGLVAARVVDEKYRKDK